jgi:putative ABC transport system permease protein
MFKTYFKIAWRNAIKNRSFTLISMSSLVLGITLFFFISLWVKDEMGYDTHFPDADRVFRLETTLITPQGKTDNTPSVGWPIGKVLATYPEVEHLTYVKNWQPVISFNEAHFYEDALYADNQFFNVFGYRLQQGNPATALSAPFSIVITPELKEKYFGKEDAIGKELEMNHELYKVTGVFAPLPVNSHLKFDMIGSFSSFCAINPEECKDEFTKGWFDINIYNYVKLRQTASALTTGAKIKDLVQQAGKEAVTETGFKAALSLRPVKDVYLYSGMRTAKGTVGNISTVKLFLVIGIFILLIACLNFINLSTARSMERAKETGIQKVLGNSRRRLIVQFLTETALLCTIAAIISIILMVALLPVFNNFTGKVFTIGSLLSASNLLLLSGIVLVLTPLAGFYPALVLSSFKPIVVLKGNFSRTASGALLRKSLVVIQFVIATGFLMCTLIMWKQMRFMQTQNLGFDQNKILIADVTKVPWVLRHNKAGVFKAALLQQKGMEQATACQAVPGRSGWDGQFAYPEGKPKDQGLVVEYIPVDADYVKTIGLTVVAGRDFLPNSQADVEGSFVINEAAVKTLGFKTPQNALGKRLSTSGKDGIVVGVLKDYHQHGLQSNINAVVLSPVSFINMVAVRYGNVQPKQAVASLQTAWDKVFKGYPMEYRFMDEDFQRQYSKEESLQSFFGLAALLSVVIGCLGLLGLIIYTAQRRIKEIGVRKVLGAGIGNIAALLSIDLLKLILIAVVLAIPFAWWAMQVWLQNFAFRVNVGWSVFALSSLAAILVALVTISFQAIKAALANPVKSLRSE